MVARVADFEEGKENLFDDVASMIANGSRSSFRFADSSDEEGERPQWIG